jgi:hypothetical protein
MFCISLFDSLIEKIQAGYGTYRKWKVLQTTALLSLVAVMITPRLKTASLGHAALWLPGSTTEKRMSSVVLPSIAYASRRE